MRVADNGVGDGSENYERISIASLLMPFLPIAPKAPTRRMIRWLDAVCVKRFASKP